MNKKSIEQAPFVVMDDNGFMQLYTHEGHIVNCNVLLKVTDGVNDFPSVMGKFLCNIVGTKEEMIEFINGRPERERIKDEMVNSNLKKSGWYDKLFK
jgi:hypothetical protein